MRRVFYIRLHGLTGLLHASPTLTKVDRKLIYINMMVVYIKETIQYQRYYITKTLVTNPLAIYGCEYSYVVSQCMEPVCLVCCNNKICLKHYHLWHHSNDILNKMSNHSE